MSKVLVLKIIFKYLEVLLMSIFNFLAPRSAPQFLEIKVNHHQSAMPKYPQFGSMST